jgi:hypothetical protein
MSQPDPTFSFALISKIASAKAAPLTNDDAPAVLRGFVDYLLKEAGMSEAEASGFVLFLAEQGGMPKQAVALPPTAPGAAASTTANAITPAAVPTPAPAVPAAAPTTSNWQHVKNMASNPKAALTGAAVGAKHPELMGMVQQYDKGDYGGLAKNIFGKGVDWISNPENRKMIAPYALTAAGTFLAAKGMGAGTGNAALAGIAGGAAGGYAWNNRKDLMKAFTPSPVAAAEPIAAAPVKPATEEPAKATSLQGDLANQTSAGASEIMKQTNAPASK